MMKLTGLFFGTLAIASLPLMVLAEPSVASSVTVGAVNKMRYIHIGAQFSKLTQDQVGQSLKVNLLDPIDSKLKHVARSYSYTVDGASRLNLSLVVEPTDPIGVKFSDTFVQAFDKRGFEGVHSKFQDVVQIIEHVDFLAGQHIAGSSDDSFHADSEILREYIFSSIQEWTKFTDRMGHALQSQTHSDFLNYVAWFIGDAKSYQTYFETVLNHDDLVFADLNPTLQFTDGSFSAPYQSPFFDVPVAGDCWAARFEKGVCGARISSAP